GAQARSGLPLAAREADMLASAVRGGSACRRPGSLWLRACSLAAPPLAPRDFSPVSATVSQDDHRFAAQATKFTANKTATGGCIGQRYTLLTCPVFGVHFNRRYFRPAD